MAGPVFGKSFGFRLGRTSRTAFTETLDPAESRHRQGASS